MTGPNMEAKREVWLLWDSDTIVKGVHPAEWCSGACVVHSPSAHNMRDSKLDFDVDTKTFRRTCLHGAVHQDPDERTYWTNQKLKAIKKAKGNERLAKEDRTYQLATEKLQLFGCPECQCGCCWIGSGSL